jgi:hypothetical protein
MSKNKYKKEISVAVLRNMIKLILAASVLQIWIRICRSRMLLGLPNPDPLVQGTDRDPDLASAPDPSIIKQNSKKNLESYWFVTSL